MSEEKPADFIYNGVPRSKKESVSRDAESRVTETTKSAIQSYLSMFLSPDGVYRSLLTRTIPYSVQFETRISGSGESDDPTTFSLQLSRLWEELRARLPCIILVDTGFSYMNPGLGGITGSWPVSRTTSSVQLSMLAKVPMELRVAGVDETQCSDLRDLLVYILGPLTHFVKGHRISSRRPEDKWEVRLSQDMQPSGLTRTAVNSDPKDGMWSSPIAIEPEFEGIVSIGFDNQIHPEMRKVFSSYDESVPLGFRSDTGELVPLSTAPSISSIRVPSTVRLGRHSLIDVPWIPALARFVTDNPKVALIDPRTNVIIPMRPGSVTVKLIQDTPGYPNGPKVLASWDIQVIPS